MDQFTINRPTEKQIERMKEWYQDHCGYIDPENARMNAVWSIINMGEVALTPFERRVWAAELKEALENEEE